MKSVFSALLGIIMMLTSMSFGLQSCNANLNKDISTKEPYNSNCPTKNILNIKSSDINKDEIDFGSMQNLIDKGGIVVVNNDLKSNISLCKKLNMNFEPEFLDSGNKESTDDGARTDLVTMYYSYQDGSSGIYVINTQNNITENEKNRLVSEAIDEIYIDQRTDSLSGLSGTSPSKSKSSNGKRLGTFTVTATCQPKGKLRTRYSFFTVQDYYGEDYYTVKAFIDGYPGKVLSAENPDYKSSFYGLSLNNSVSTSTSSVTLLSYGPYRTVKATSYSVSVGGAFSKASGAEFNANFEYSKNISDTDIEASSTTKKAYWDITLKSTARKKTISFVPAATYVCPQDKGSVTFSLSADYTLDSLTTLRETISVNRNIVCSPSGWRNA